MESIKMLKFEYIYNKVGGSKCWSLSEKRGIDQNVKIWGQSGESIILLKCEDKVGNQIHQNVEILV